MAEQIKIEKIYNLSPTQEGMLFHSLLQEGEANKQAYFVQLSFSLQGDLDISLLKQSLQYLIQRHDILRTNFVYKNLKQPKQVVLNTRKAEFDFTDIAHLPIDQIDKMIQTYYADDRKRYFDLSKGSLMRLRLFKVKEKEHRVIWSSHHLLLDGWSMGILFQELFLIYNQLKDQQQVSLPAIKPYAEFIKWLKENDRSESMKYWHQQLAEYESPAVLPYKQGSNPGEKVYKEIQFSVDKQLTQSLTKLSKQHQVTLNTLFQGLWSILLQRYANQKDVVFGSVLSGRTAAFSGMEQIVGPLIYTVPVRIQQDDLLFNELLLALHGQSISAVEHGHCSLYEIQQNSACQQELFDHILVFENYPLDQSVHELMHGEQQALKISNLTGFEPTNYPLVIQVSPGECLQVKITYDEARYEDQFITNIEKHLQQVMNTIIIDPDIKINEMDLLSDAERKQLQKWNQTATPYPENQMIHTLFEQQVAKTPDKIAVVFQDEQLTYQELNERANRVATVLRAKGIKPDDRVGLLMDRSIEMMVGILGILKSGGAYVPIDIEYPIERIRYMLADSGAEFVLSQQFVFKKFCGEVSHTTGWLDVQQLMHAEEYETSNLPIVNQSNDLVYVIYTSGTTGKPKGVMMEHCQLVNLLSDQMSRQQIPFDQHVLQFSVIGFDVSFQEIFSTLLSGGSLHVVDQQMRRDVRALLKYMDEQAISVVYWPVSYLKAVFQGVDCLPPSTKHVITAGEQLIISPALKRCIVENQLHVHNHYGPAETHVVTTHTLTADQEIAEYPPIGKPIANTKIYLLNEHGQLQPPGMVGEIYIAGNSVGRGYLGKPELTAARFCENPFVPVERMYRTGDLGRYLPDGSIEFLGRIDQQVKVRGYRIELGEIESTLVEHPQIKNVVIRDWQDQQQGTYLCAYVVSDQLIDPAELNVYMKQKLPDYMIPSFIVQIDKIPLTPNRKVDREALPKPDTSSVKQAYVAPTTKLESQLTEIWQQVLGIERIGITDHFFELGGHSIKAIQLMSLVHQQLQLELPVHAIFEHPTIQRLAIYAQEQKEGTFQSIQPAPVQSYYPVSSAQKRMYVLQQLELEATHYNMPGAIMFEGMLDARQLENAMQALIQRHEALRTSFTVVDGEPVQHIHDQVDWELSIRKGTESEAKAWIKPFVLEQAPLFRAELIQLAQDKHLLLIDFHHIIADGVSVDVLLQDLSKLYHGESLPALRIQYKDFAVWEQEWMKSDNFQRQEQYWLKQFADELPVVELPTDHPRPEIQRFEGRHVTFALDQKLTNSLKQLASETGTTLYMLLLTAYYVLLHKYTGQTDLIVGSPVVGRSHADVQKMMGMFVNTLAMRNRPEGHKKWMEFIEEVKTAALAAYDHADYPFEMLVEKLPLDRDTSRNPLLQTMFTMQDVGTEMFQLDQVAVKPFELDYAISKFDLSLFTEEKQDRIVCQFEYATALFEPNTIERMSRHFVQIMQAMVSQPQQCIADVDMLTKEEKQQLLVEWNNTAAPYPKDQTIHTLFEQQAVKTPNKIAVVFQDEELTYQELNERANRVAHSLHKRGVKPNDRVGLLIDRSPAMMVGLLGILKSGGAYVPIDPEYPTERISYMLGDSSVQIVLSQMDLMQQFKTEIALDLTWVNIESIEQSKGKIANLPIINQSTDLAYVMYTSGTTGQPKGVEIEHRSVVRLVKGANYVKLDEQQVILQLATTTFDASTFEIWGSLLNGAKLVMMESNRPSLEEIASTLERENVTILFLTTALFNVMVDHHLNSLVNVHQLLMGGEAFSSVHVQTALSLTNTQLIHVYGPTENTTYTTYYLVSHDWNKNDPLPIGKPISNTKVYILDKTLKPVPVGVAGELYVSGDGLAREYLGKPALTAEKFVPNPFVPSERMYRTGDLARYLPDGNIEFLGRIDQQVKIRGFRIEPGEIESVLMEHPQVKTAHVRDWKNDRGETYLCAYAVLDGSISIAELKNDISQKLPNYMIPAFILELEEIPLKPNGKVDRGAVPRPEGEQLQKEYVAPSTELEIQLAQIWQNVLEIERVGVTDHFFELGGHSLKAIQLMSFVHQQLQIELPVRTIFEYPTIQGLAMYVQEQERHIIQSIQPAPVQPYYPVSSAQKRMYALQQMELEATHYNMPGAIMLEGVLDARQLDIAIQALIQRHEALRTSFTVVDGELVQHIHDQVDWKLSVRKGTESEAEDWIKPFSLDQAPLFRAELIQLAHDKHLLLIDLHHIIADGVSMDVLWQDLSTLYRGNSLPELRIQYKDFAVWEQEWLESGNLQQQEQYWLEQFADELPVLELPTDQPRPEVQSFAGKHLSFALDQELTTSLKQLASETGTTLYMLLLTAYNVLLHKYTGQTDLIVGSPVVGRTYADVQKIMGMFVNTLAMRNRPEGHKKWLEFIEEVKTAALSAYEHADYPFEMLVEKLPLDRDTSRNPLLQTIFTMQDIGTEMLQLDQVAVKFYELDYAISKFDLSLFTKEKQDRIVCQFEYATSLFEPSTIERMSHHFVQIVQAMVSQPQQCIADVDMLTQEEQQQLLVDWNETAAPYPKNKTIHQLFEEQVAKTPDQIAVIYKDQQLTYQELNQRANCVTHVLRERGIKPDDRVGLFMNRSLELMVGLLGILKSGGAYVPIDAEYPTERIRYMLGDSGVKFVLSQIDIMQQFEAEIELDVTWLDIQSIEQQKDNMTNLPFINQPTDLAYVIYTSGTTGRPKGVMIEHEGWHHLIRNFQETWGIGEQDKMGQFASIAFDAFAWEWGVSLLSGACLHLIPRATILDRDAFESYVDQHKLSLMLLPPPYLSQLNRKKVSSLRKVVVGGSASSRELVEQWKDIYINAYGPTEATVIATTWETALEDDTHTVPIGKPIANKKVYIVSETMQLQPVGVPGELCIGGVGLARGYLNQSELTAEKFILNPFVPGERMYRTGDLARWLPDGNIEFLGRIDQQVKVRGFRIELGEIESVLMEHPQVKNATVRDWQNDQGETYLCAYVVLDGAITIAELKTDLSQKLPNYMIPAFLLELEELPLTSNGKVDHGALPQPEGEQLQKEYVAPSTALEVQLAEIWQNVLGIERVGVTDHFFELGGDSIKAIQVVAKLQNQDLELSVNRLFRSPTIRKVIPYIEERTKQVRQDQIQGEVPLTPIQHEFFMHDDSLVNHFNQAMVLFSPTALQESVVEKVLTKLVEHHDALRMVYQKQEQRWIQINRAMEEHLFRFTTIDLRNQINVHVKMEQLADQMQRCFDITTGPLMNVVIFKTDEGDYLLFVVHHLVVDGVSWRILLEDFISGYQSASKQEAIQLPMKTHSYLDWAQGLQEYANHVKLKKESEYWKKVCHTDVVPLPKDREVTENLIQDSDEVEIALTSAQTRQLLSEIHHAYNTEINDILLTALGMTIREWTDHDTVGLMLEGHGREEILDQLQIHRTVGWFTSCFPVALDLQAQAGSEDEEISQQIKQVKETLRRVPERGIGYGILKYISQTADLATCEPEIVFNYLGQFDAKWNSDTPFQFSTLNPGRMIHPQMKRAHALMINGSVVNGQLRLQISYSQKQYNSETILKLARQLRENLERVINHCYAKSETEKTPSDLRNKSLSIPELADVQSIFDEMTESSPVQVDKVYNLTPMQEGMLYHALMHEEEENYLVQMAFSIHGKLNMPVFQQSVARLIQRHDILRTNFIHQNIRKPQQVVLNQRQESVNFEDVSHLTDEEIRYLIESYQLADRKLAFNLEKDLLTRFQVFQVADNEFRVIWSFHHILLDGWSMGILLKELFSIYSAIQGEQSLQLSEIKPYVEFVEWLDEQDQQKALAYWKQLLAGYESQALLPTNTSLQEQHQTGEHQVVEFDFGEELTAALVDWSKKYQVTVNTLFQAMWAMMLQRYANQEDVVFGSVLSGRSAGIRGIDQMVGLFINTVPVRVQKSDGPFIAFVQDLQQQFFASEENYYSPLYEIQKQTMQDQPLFDHIIGFENYPLDQKVKDLLHGKKQELRIGDVTAFELTNYPFAIQVYLGKSLGGKITYNDKLYDPQLIEKMEKHFKQVAQTIINEPDINVKQIDMLTIDEKQQLVVEWNDTAAFYPKNKTIHQLFEKQVAKTPDNIALVYEDKQLTYRELNQRANCVAHVLRTRGVKPDDRVGLFMNRSLEQIVGLLGILKSGGAYVPIDPEYPIDRISYILEDSSVEFVLSQMDIMRQFATKVSVELTWLDVQSIEQPKDNMANLPMINKSTDLAYVIYTSGTTGRPKGVMIEHEAWHHLIRYFQETLDIGEQDKIGQFSSISFDVFNWEFGASLLSGACLYLIPQTTILDPGAFERYVNQHKLSLMVFPPPYLNQLDRKKISSLRKIITGGSASSRELAEQWKDIYMNAYGPTEATVIATSWETMLEDDTHIVPIGKPIANKKAYIVNEAIQLQPVGVPGELCIGGVGLARGYLNQPELTAEKFIPNPFVPGERIYRTGDLARYLPDGNIEFLGRIDQQVKVRGFRIEPGEIESVLLEHPQVKNATVRDWKDEQGDTYLCAYVVLDGAITIAELKNVLSQKLPNYMVPAFILALEEIPITTNGKVDRKALPRPERSQWRQKYVAPSTEQEVQLAEIWQDVLDIERVGVTDHFFELGGHSLKAMTLVSQIAQKLKKQVHLPTVFRYPTIREFVQSALQGNDTQIVTQLNKKADMNLFCFPPIIGYGSIFSEVAAHIQTHTLYSFDFVDQTDRIQQYIETIVSIQPEGSYELLGYSAGCSLTFEVAKEMENRGYEVSKLILLDGAPQKGVRMITAEELQQESEKEAEMLLQHQLKTHFVSISKQVIVEQIERYKTYLHRLVSEGQLRAPIHLIASEDNVSEVADWDQMTYEYDKHVGAGGHTDMLVSPFLEKNVEIIRNILMYQTEKLVK